MSHAARDRGGISGAFVGAEDAIRYLHTAAGPYAVALAIPRGDVPPQGFPALYVLDAGATFAIARNAALLQAGRPDATGVAPGVVVGLAYPGRPEERLARRARDFTPDMPSAELPPHSSGGPWPAWGGAESFLRVLLDDIMPVIDGLAPIDQDRKALFGHSLGGLFALWALAQEPSRFRVYGAASPSLWVARRPLGEGLATLPQRLPSGPRREAALFAGALEQPETEAATPEGRGERQRRNRIVDNARETAAKLARLAPERLAASLTVFPDENHVSSLPAALSRIVRIAFASSPADQIRVETPVL